MSRPPVRVRELSAKEAEAIQRLAHSRTEAARKVERAKIIWLSREGQTVPAIASELHLDPDNVRARIKRFNETGLAALEDAPRSGRPATYTAEEVGHVVATALTNPTELGRPFAMWTLDRLQAYLFESRGVRMKRSRIDQILIAEGLRWRKQETWFGERVDPEFAEKRGPSPNSTRNRRPKA